MEVRTLRETPRGPHGLPWVSFRTWRVSTASAKECPWREGTRGVAGIDVDQQGDIAALRAEGPDFFSQCCSLWLKRYLRNPPRALLRIKESEHPFLLLKPPPCVDASFAATSLPKARVMAARLL